MKRAFVLAIGLLVVSACDDPRQKPQAVEHAASNNTYELTLLFIHDGVKMYRFYDKSEYRYFAVPNSGAPAETQTTYGCGKNCTYEGAIQTLPLQAHAARK